MKCPNCGNETNNENYMFCTKCGAKLNTSQVNSQDNSTASNLSSNNNANNQYYDNTPQYNYNNNENNNTNKKSLAPLIIAIVSVSVILLAIGIAAIFSFSSYGERSSMAVYQEEFEDFMEENLPDVDYEDTKNRIDSDDNNVEIVTEPPTETTTRESTYTVYLSDVTWQEAHSNCAQVGGHLVTIESQEEFNKITSMLSGYDTKVIFYVGAARSPSSNEYYWVNKAGYSMGEPINSSSWWLTNEPSFYDKTTGYDETAVCLLYSKKEGRWVLNDIPNDYLGAVPNYRGQSRVAYICEFS